MRYESDSELIPVFRVCKSFSQTFDHERQGLAGSRSPSKTHGPYKILIDEVPLLFRKLFVIPIR